MGARSAGELVELVEDAAFLGDRGALAGLLEAGAALLGPAGVGAGRDPMELLAGFVPAPGGGVAGRGLMVCLSAASGTVLVARRDPVHGWLVAALVRLASDLHEHA
jgi:outer membrane lipoprotein SlyB